MKKIWIVIISLFVFAPFASVAFGDDGFTVTDEVMTNTQSVGRKLSSRVEERLPGTVHKAVKSGQGEMSKLTKRVGVAEGKITESKSLYATFVHSFNSWVDKVKGVESSNSQNEAYITAANERIDGLEASMGGVKKDVAEAKSDAAEAKSNAKTASTIVSVLLIAGIIGCIAVFATKRFGKKANTTATNPMTESTNQPISNGAEERIVGAVNGVKEDMNTFKTEIKAEMSDLKKKVDGVAEEVVNKMRELDPTPFVYELMHEGNMWQITWDAYNPTEKCYDLLFVHQFVTDVDERHPELFDLKRERNKRGKAERSGEDVLEKALKYLVGSTTPGTTQEKVQVAVIKYLSKANRLTIKMK